MGGASFLLRVERDAATRTFTHAADASLLS
jgi:hypothetical protein